MRRQLPPPVSKESRGDSEFLSGRWSPMQDLTTLRLGQACRLFMTLAYPGGPATIPAKKRVYYDIPPEAPATDFLPPAACAVGVCEVLRNETAAPCGYALRL